MAENKQFFIDQKQCDALCTCGSRHAPPQIRIHAGEDAFVRLAEDCRSTVGTGRMLLVDDENTHLAAGASVSDLLKKQALDFKTVSLPGDAVLTDRLARKISAQAAGVRLIIAVGAGTINDLGKYVSDQIGIPYWSVPTAPSMNGYTSSIAAVKVKGVKRTLPAKPPQSIYVHPGVIQNAPLKLRQAGFCDVLAKSVSDFDWQTESFLFNGSYCGLPSAILNEPEQKYIHHPEKILAGDMETVFGLFEGLLFSGIAMSLAGSSAPASGGEHLISHFFDMRESITGKKPALHGLQVGAGVVLSAVCYRMLADLETKNLRPAARDRFEADARKIPAVWADLAREVEKQFYKKQERLLSFDTLLPANWQHLKALFSQVRKPDFFIDLIRRTGFDMTLPSLGMSTDEFFLAAVSARTIRERITVLDLSAHAGILEEAAERTIAMLT